MSLLRRKMRPLLVDAETLNKLLEIKKMELIPNQNQEPSQLSKFMKSITSSFLDFIKKYIFFIIIFMCIFVYLYFRNKSYQKEKIKEQEMQKILELDREMKKAKKLEYIERKRHEEEDKKNKVKNLFLERIHEDKKIHKYQQKHNSHINPQLGFPNATQISEMSRIDIDDCLRDKTVDDSRHLYDVPKHTTVGITNGNELYEKNVRFDDRNSVFDAYDRNFINPKLGKRIDYAIPSGVADNFAYV